MKKFFWTLSMGFLITLLSWPLLAGKDQPSSPSEKEKKQKISSHKKKSSLKKEEAGQSSEDNKWDRKNEEETVVEDDKALEKAVEDMVPLSGYFNLFKKESTLYAHIKADQLKKPFLLAMTLTRGVNAGLQWDHMLVYWARQGNKLLLMRPDVRYQGGESTLASVVEKTYPATILRTVPVLAANKDGDTIVDFTNLFISDLSGVGANLPEIAGITGELNPSLSRWSKIKAFPYNLEIEVELAFTGLWVKGEGVNGTDSSDSGRSYRVGVHYSLSHIPESQYKARMADPRVGYFTTAIKDFSRPYSSRSYFLRYIQRWNLEKADPNAEVSPPKNPIVFYMSKSIPYRFRRYVREGITEWNKAFEKIGFVDTIVVRQQTEKEFADLDPADVRYNFFLWTAGELGYAMGPSRVNPLTGEILDADIVFDDSMLRAIQSEYQNLSPSSSERRDEKLEYFSKKMKAFHNQETLYPWDQKDSAKKASIQKLTEKLGKRGHPFCNYAMGLRHQFYLGSLLFQALGLRKLPEDLVGSYVRETVMHEVGHTLGLYHNFKASSWRSLSEVNSKEKPGDTSGSVMDYNALNFVAPGGEQGHYLPQTIGPYDYWAIEYGYKSAPKDDDTRELEEKMLQEIASKSGTKGLAYANDQFSSMTDPDPHIALWDLGDNQIAFAQQRLQLIRYIMDNLVDKVVKPGENYYGVRLAFSALMREYSYAMSLTARYVGGAYLSFDHKGDPQAKPPVQPVDPAKQKEAFQFLSKTIFSESGLVIPAKVLPYLAPGTQWHWDSDELSPRATYPVQEALLSIQEETLVILLNPLNLWRLSNFSLQQGKDAFLLSDLLDGLSQTIWSEISKDLKKEKPSRENPLISSVRRNLQRKYLEIWIEYFVLDRSGTSIPEDAKTMGRKNLMTLVEKLEKLKGQAMDSESEAHISESIQKIKQALKVYYIK